MTRLAALLSLLLTLAACGSSPGSPTPSAPSSLSASPGDSAPSSAEPSAIPDSAEPSCQLPADTLTITLRGIHSSADIDVPVAAGGAASSAPADSAAPSDSAGGPPDAGQFVGGTTYRVAFQYDVQDATAVQVTPTSVTASLTTNGATKNVPATVSEGGADLTLPDGTGPATLTIQPTIDAAPCPKVSPSATFALTLVPSAAAAACPSDEDSSIALLQKLDTRLRIGASTQAFDTQAFQARYNAAGGSDSVPAFANFDPSAPAVSVNANANVTLVAAGKDLTLTGADVQVWRRSDVVGSDNQLLTSPGDPIDHQTLAAAKGSATWQAPATPGQFVLGVFPTWTSDCLTGQGYLYVSLTSR